MRAGLAVVVAFAACGSPQRASTVDNEEAPKPRRWIKSLPDRVASAPRPDVNVEQLVPDFHEELRWPLSLMSHPELTPQFEIAQVFALPGIGWIELCERGIQNRVQSGRNRDELEYLRGWCSAVKGDADAACGRLKPLTASTVYGMSAAVRTDLANIIATAGDIDVADKLLNKHRIDDIEVLDLLAATYVELGRERDAHEMNRRALEFPEPTTNALHCRRLVKDIVLSKGSARVSELEQLATKSKVPDETCVSLYDELKCWQGPAWNCESYFKGASIDPKTIFLLSASRKWPSRPSNWRVWITVAHDAIAAMPLPDAQQMARLALDAARKSGPRCEPMIMQALRRAWPAPRPQQLKDEFKWCRWDPDL
jgi:hypothetical protein